MTKRPDVPSPDDPPADIPHPDDLLADAPLPEDPPADVSLPADPPAAAKEHSSRGERRLAAILFADVAGYTALSSHDEDLALSLIEAFQRLSHEHVNEKGGRVVKFLGDGMLAEFSSLDSAVNAAHALQTSFPYLKEVEASHVSLRVGVHLGDIVFGVDGDVYGSGVNVASRIEGHAPLSGVVVSDSAYQQLRHRRHYTFSSIGEKELKGVPDPMELYVVLLADKNGQVSVQPLPGKSKDPGKRRSKMLWMAVAFPLVVGAVAVTVAMDFGGIQGRADELLADLGLPTVFTVFPRSPEYRAIEGGAAIDAGITVGFSRPIDPATATRASVQLLGPNEALVPAEVSASEDASAVAITPLSPLAYSTRYRIVLTSELRSSSGEAIRPPRGAGPPEDLLSFVTQPMPPDPPVLASTDPANGSTGADGAGPVLATFSKPMNPQTLDSTTVKLLAESGALVAVELTCCGENDGTLRVDPVEPMAAGVYRLVLGSGITDMEGIPLLTDTVGFRVGRVARPARPVTPTGPGRLTIQVIPASVAPRTIVVIDGETLGPAPIQNREVPEGVAHRIEIFGTSQVSRETISIYDSQQTLSPAQNLTVNAEVTPFGTINIASVPGGRVFIDGVEIGPTPLVSYPVTAGPVHTMEIRPLATDAEARGPYVANFRVELLEDKSLGRVELPVR